MGLILSDTLNARGNHVLACGYTMTSFCIHFSVLREHSWSEKEQLTKYMLYYHILPGDNLFGVNVSNFESASLT